MFATIAFGIIPSVLLLVGGGITIWRAVIAFRQGPALRLRGILLLIAGVGTLLLILLAIAPWVGWNTDDYGALYIPLVALAIAVVWNLVFLVAAAVVGRRARASEAAAL